MDMLSIRVLNYCVNSNQTGLNKVFRLRKVVICRIIILIGSGIDGKVIKNFSNKNLLIMERIT